MGGVSRLSKLTMSTCIKENISSQHIAAARLLGLRGGCLAQGQVEEIELAATLCGLNMVWIHRVAAFSGSPSFFLLFFIIFYL